MSWNVYSLEESVDRAGVFSDGDREVAGAEDRQVEELSRMKSQLMMRMVAKNKLSFVEEVDEGEKDSYDS